MKTTLLVAMALTVTACAHGPGPRDAAQSLAAAETAFAAHSVREDMRAAFMAHFAADGLMVRNGWTVARDWLATRPAPPIVLEWRPAHVEVAASGELGLSTGPSRITAKDGSRPPAFGQFVSVWKRVDGGPWKVAIDLGIGHAQPTYWDTPLDARVTPAAPLGGSTMEETERLFARTAATDGERAGYRRHGDGALRRYRDTFEPQVGLAASLASPSMSDARIAWTIERAEVARSNDLGYVIGSYADASAPANVLGQYLRVWRREAGGWKIVMDVVNAARR